MYANDDVCNKHSQQLRTEEEASAIHARRPTASPTTTALLPCEEMLLFSFFQLCCPVPFFSLSHRSPATLHRRSSIMTTAVYVLLWCIMMPSLLLVVRPVAAEVSLTCFPSATAYVITPSSIGTDRVVSLRSCPFPIIVNFTEGAASNTMIVISGSALPIMYFYDTLINTSITIASSYSYSTSDAATVAQLDAVPCYLCVVALQVDFLSITVADTTIVLNQTTASATTTGAQRSFILFGMVQTATSSGLIPYPTKSVALTMSHSTVQIFSTNTAPDYLSVGTIGALVILSTNVAGPMNIVIASASNITSSGNWTLNPLVHAATTVSQATVIISSGSQLNMTTPAMFLFNGVVTSVNVTFDSSAVVWIAPNSNAISNPAMIVVLGNTTARDINRDVNLLISRSTITARKAVSSLSPAFSACVGPAQGWSWTLVDSVVIGLDRGIILLSQTSQFSLACYGSVMGISLLVLSAQTLDNASLLFASGTTTPSPSSTFTPSSWVNANRLSNARAVVTDSGTSIIVMLAIQANYMYNASVYIQSGATLSTPALISFTSVCVLCVSTVMENASLDVSGVGTTLFANAIYLYFGFPLAIPAGFISTLFGSLANVTLSVRHGAIATLQGADVSGAISGGELLSRATVIVDDNATIIVNGPGAALIGGLENITGGCRVTITNHSTVWFPKALDRAPYAQTTTSPGGAYYVGGYYSSLILAGVISGGCEIAVLGASNVWTEHILFTYVLLGETPSMISIGDDQSSGGDGSCNNITLFGSVAIIRGTSLDFTNPSSASSSTLTDNNSTMPSPLLSIVIGNGTIIQHRSTKPWCIYKNSVSFTPATGGVGGATTTTSAIGPASTITLERVRIHIEGLQLTIFNTSIAGGNLGGKNNESATHGFWWRSIALLPSNATAVVQDTFTPQRYWNVTIVNVTVAIVAPPKYTTTTNFNDASMLTPLIGLPFSLASSSFALDTVTFVQGVGSSSSSAWVGTFGSQVKISGASMDNVSLLISGVTSDGFVLGNASTTSSSSSSSQTWAIDVTSPPDQSQFWVWWAQYLAVKGTIIGSPVNTFSSTRWSSWSRVVFAAAATSEENNATLVTCRNLASVKVGTLLDVSNFMGVRVEIRNSSLSSLVDGGGQQQNPTTALIRVNGRSSTIFLAQTMVNVTSTLLHVNAASSSSVVESSNNVSVMISASHNSVIAARGHVASIYTAGRSSSTAVSAATWWNASLQVSNNSFVDVVDAANISSLSSSSSSSLLSSSSSTTSVFAITVANDTTLGAKMGLSLDVGMMSQVTIGGLASDASSSLLNFNGGMVRAVWVLRHDGSADTTDQNIDTFINVTAAESSVVALDGSRSTASSVGLVANIRNSSSASSLQMFRTAQMSINVANNSVVQLNSATVVATTVLHLWHNESAATLIPVVFYPQWTTTPIDCSGVVDTPPQLLLDVIVSGGSTMSLQVDSLNNNAAAMKAYFDAVANLAAASSTSPAPFPITGTFVWAASDAMLSRTALWCGSSSNASSTTTSVGVWVLHQSRLVLSSNATLLIDQQASPSLSPGAVHGAAVIWSAHVAAATNSTKDAVDIHISNSSEISLWVQQSNSSATNNNDVMSLVALEWWPMSNTTTPTSMLGGSHAINVSVRSSAFSRAVISISLSSTTTKMSDDITSFVSANWLDRRRRADPYDTSASIIIGSMSASVHLAAIDESSFQMIHSLDDDAIIIPAAGGGVVTSHHLSCYAVAFHGDTTANRVTNVTELSITSFVTGAFNLTSEVCRGAALLSVSNFATASLSTSPAISVNVTANSTISFLPSSATPFALVASSIVSIRNLSTSSLSSAVDGTGLLALDVATGSSIWLSGALVDAENIHETNAGGERSGPTAFSAVVTIHDNTTFVLRSNVTATSSLVEGKRASVLNAKNFTFQNVTVHAPPQLMNGQTATQRPPAATFVQRDEVWTTTTAAAIISSTNPRALVSLQDGATITNKLQISGGRWISQHLSTQQSTSSATQSPMGFAVSLGDSSFVAQVSVSDAEFDEEVVVDTRSAAASSSSRAMARTLDASSLWWSPIVVEGSPPPSASSVMSVNATYTSLTINPSMSSLFPTYFYVIAFANATIQDAWVGTSGIVFTTTFGCSFVGASNGSSTSSSLSAVLWDTPSCFPTSSSASCAVIKACPEMVTNTSSHTMSTTLSNSITLPLTQSGRQQGNHSRSNNSLTKTTLTVSHSTTAATTSRTPSTTFSDSASYSQSVSSSRSHHRRRAVVTVTSSHSASMMSSTSSSLSSVSNVGTMSRSIPFFKKRHSDSETLSQATKSPSTSLAPTAHRSNSNPHHTTTRHPPRRQQTHTTTKSAGTPAPSDALGAATNDSNTVGIAVGATIGGIALLGIVGALVFVFVIRPRQHQRVVKDLDDTATPLRDSEEMKMQQLDDASVTIAVPRGETLQGNVNKKFDKPYQYFEADDDVGPMLMSVVSHGGVDYTVMDEDEEGFYDAEGYYHYYEDDT